MNMRAEIDIVTGFLGSGKTTLINTLLKNTLAPKEIVLILQCESGEQKINSKLNDKGKIIIKEYNPSEVLTSAYLKQMINFFNPNRIIIEYNGMKLLGDILGVLGDSGLDGLCMEPAIYHIADAVTFDIFFINMKEIVEPYINHSNLIVLNNGGSITEEKRKSLKKQIETINSNAFIINLEDIEELDSALKRADILDDGILRNLRIAFKNKITKRIARRR